jgi:hypothetical protein
MPVSLTRDTIAPKSVRKRITKYLNEGLPPTVLIEKFNWSTGKGKALEGIQHLQRRIDAMRQMPQEPGGRRANIVWANWLRMRKKLFQALRKGLWRLDSFQNYLKSSGVMPFYLGEHAVIATPDDGYLCFETGGIVAVILESKAVFQGPFCERCHPEEYASFIKEHGSPYPPMSAIQKTA